MTLDQIIQSVGLPGVVLGGLVEGEGAAFFTGVLVHRGFFAFEPAALALALGAAISDNLTFLAGRRFARSPRVQRMMQGKAMARMTGMVHRNVTMATLGFRFVYGFKTVGPLAIGTGPIGWLRFAALDAVAVLVWAHVFLGLGLVAGHTIETLFGRLRLHWHLAVALLAFLAVVGALGYARARIVRRKGAE